MAGNPSLAPWCHRGQNLFFEPFSNVTRKTMLLYLRCQVVVDGIPDVPGAAHRTHYRRRRVPSTARATSSGWFVIGSVFISPTAKNILSFFSAVVKKQQLKKLHITGRVGSFAPPFLTCVKCLPLPKVRRLRSLTVVGVV